MFRKNVVSLFLFVLLAAFLLAFTYIVRNADSPQKTAQQLGNLISERNDVIRRVSDSLSKEVLFLKPSSNLFESRVSDLIQQLDEYVNVAIYDKNELRFWSGHQYFPNFSSFSQLQDGVFSDPASQSIYLISDTAYNTIRIIVFDLVYERHFIENQLIANGFSSKYKKFAGNFTAEMNTSAGVGVYDKENKLLFKITKSDLSRANSNRATTAGLLFILLALISLLYFFGARVLDGLKTRHKTLAFFVLALVLPVFVIKSRLFESLFGVINFDSSLIFQNLALPSLLVFAHGFLSFFNFRNY